ncbi:MAG: HNH endonuclease [Rivularia sp. (in: cyanobacteria)]
MNSKQKWSKKAQLLSEYGSCCCWCGCCLPAEKLTLEHLKPKSKGGSNSLENLRLACVPCNKSRGNRHFLPPRLFALKSIFIFQFLIFICYIRRKNA